MEPRKSVRQALEMALISMRLLPRSRAASFQGLSPQPADRYGGAGGGPAVRAARSQHGGLPGAGRALPHGRVLAARGVARVPPVAPQGVAARRGGRRALLRARARRGRSHAAVAAAGALAAPARRARVALSAAWVHMACRPQFCRNQAAIAEVSLSVAWQRRVCLAANSARVRGISSLYG